MMAHAYRNCSVRSGSRLLSEVPYAANWSYSGVLGAMSNNQNHSNIHENLVERPSHEKKHSFYALPE